MRSENFNLFNLTSTYTSTLEIGYNIISIRKVEEVEVRSISLYRKYRTLFDKLFGERCTRYTIGGISQKKLQPRTTGLRAKKTVEVNAERLKQGFSEGAIFAEPFFSVFPEVEVRCGGIA